MIDAIVLDGKGEELVGKFQFEALPRKGDEITVPWADDPYGFRIFSVDEVRHTAAGVETAQGTGPFTILAVSEIT